MKNRSLPTAAWVRDPAPWKVLTIVTEWGNDCFFVCPVCAAVVEFRSPHEQWHESFNDSEIAKPQPQDQPSVGQGETNARNP